MEENTPGEYRPLIDRKELVATLIRPTSGWKRLGNYLIDSLFASTVTYSIMGLIALLGGVFEGGFNTEKLLSAVSSLQIVALLIPTSYFVVFEHFFKGKSFGKMVTGTKVVMPDGSQPPLRNIIGRSFSRLIPFDAFSFLASHPKGWHDTISGTMVVDDLAIYDLGKNTDFEKEESF
jgi:uncharacterized RDD family membrane protein YckC